MFNIPFFKTAKRSVGIDIGTFSIKIVELSYSKNKVTLENYGEKVSQISDQELYKSLRRKAFFASDEEIAEIIKNILREAKISTKEAFLSIPDFMSFFTVFSTPPISREEVASVVQFEARQHVPLPLQEMTIDWSIIDEKLPPEQEKEKKGLRVLLVAVPNKAMNRYEKIASLAGIKLAGLEAEVFSLLRAAVKGDDLKKVIQLIDVGIQSTTITIIRNNMIVSTYSIDFSISEIIKHLADILGMSYNEAGKALKNQGLEEDTVDKIIRPKIDSLISESIRVANEFSRNERKDIEKIILAGGSALMPKLKEYFSSFTGKETQIIDTFSEISYPSDLNEIIEEVSPRYAIATGLALRGVEKK